MKIKKLHRVPLCERAVAIVKELRAAHPRSTFVFPGHVPGEPLHVKAMLLLLQDLCPGLDVTVHGFRSSFRDWAGDETHTAHDICEAALAHTRGKVHGAYQRRDLL